MENVLNKKIGISTDDYEKRWKEQNEAPFVDRIFLC